MNLSALLITYHLKKKYKTMVSSWISGEPHLKYPLHYQGEKNLADGTVYVVDDPNFVLPSHHLSKVFLILTGADFSISEKDYPNLCILPPEISADETLSFLQKIFSRYEEWNQSLFESRLSNSTIQDLLDRTASVIPNPIMVIGMDFTVVASRGYQLKGLRNSVLGSTEETRALVNALKQDPNYEEAFHRIGYFYFPGNDIADPSLCVNIMRFGKTVYRIMISAGEVPLDDTFGFLLEYLARMVSHALTTNVVSSHDASHSLHQIFQTLLTDPSADYVEISQQFSAAGWLPSHSYQCILIKTGILDFKNLTLRAICGYVENSIPSSCAVEHHGNVVVYINLDLCSLSLDEISQKLASFIRDSLLNAGYSRKMLGHFNFQRQYVQASIALQFGKRKSPSQWIHQFNQIALPYLLEQTTKKLPAYMVCHEKLLSLKYADETNHSQLYQTVRCYLEHHQSITKTSEALFIHRSTLLYRLDKIKEVLKTDFSDPDELLYLLLSFHLLDLEELQGTEP